MGIGGANRDALGRSAIGILVASDMSMMNWNHRIARVWIIAFIACAIVGGIALRPDKGISAYLTARDIDTTDPMLSHGERRALSKQGVQGPSEEETDLATNNAHADILRKNVVSRRKDARRDFLIFVAISLLGPTCACLVAMVLPMPGRSRR